MILDTRRLILVESGRFKLAATSRLAEGGSEAAFEASVMFHAAARAERRALNATEAPTAHDRLRSAVEICGCLIAALDPSAVLESAWGQVLEASEPLPAEEASAIRARLDAKFATFLRSYQRTLKRVPRAEREMTEGKAPSQAQDLAVLLEVFPGDPRFWTSLAAARSVRGNVGGAWQAIQRARKLDPDDSSVRQYELHLVSDLDPSQARAVLETAYREVLADRDADLCFGFVSGATRLGLKQNDPIWLTRALEISALGMSLPPLHPLDRAWFNAFRLILHELLAGRRPGVEILFRAGLGAWAVASAKKDPIEILLHRASMMRAA